MRSRRYQSGFSAAEMLVVSAIATMLIGGMVAAYATVMRGQRQHASTATVTLPAGAATNFYPTVSGNSITTFLAPNYGSVSRAEILREKFVIDTSKAVAVFCLSRPVGTYNTIRPVSIPSPVWPVAPLDTPEAFRAHLNATVGGASAIFSVAQRPTPSTPCFSIFVLGYSAVAASIPVLAVYDLDIVNCTRGASGVLIGSYAALRRYVNTSGTPALTGYYDVIYPAGTNDAFQPTIVTFERFSRRALAEGSTGLDRFKVAPEKPFYFIFWPDPAMDSLRLPAGNTPAALNPSLADTEARKTYNHMAGRTAFWFTTPMFPSL